MELFSQARTRHLSKRYQDIFLLELSSYSNNRWSCKR